jgi:hypothetical protein
MVAVVAMVAVIAVVAVVAVVAVLLQGSVTARGYHCREEGVECI